MNRRTFGKLTLLGTLGTLAGGNGAQVPPPAEDARAKDRKTYLPTINSIRTHPSPGWFDDIKFGMFIDFGLYSVAGYAPKKASGAMYPDWYLFRMYDTPEVAEYHREKWGKDFQRDDFIPLFTAKNFDAEELARVAEESGMRYVVPFCKHHDGFCLWPSSYTRRNSLKMGPKRDLIGPLSDACAKRGLKFGFYFSLEEWEYPVIRDGKKMIRRWTTVDGQPDLIEAFDEAAMAGKITGKIPVHDFARDYTIPQANEFIDRYDPDILWLDGEWTAPAEELGSPEIVSHFYNHAEGRKEVAANDRLGRFMRFSIGDFFTSEYGAMTTERSKLLHKWEENRGASQSFGYNWQDTAENVVGAGDLIDMLVRIVSENGNLLLVVNLDGTGAMPAYIRDRLLEVGRWLKVNGEAIYNSRPWLVQGQGDAITFTRSKDGRFLYAVHKGWPPAQVELHDLWLDASATITMLGAGKPLEWKNVPAGSYGRGGKVVVLVPESMKGTFSSEHAVTLKVEIAD